MNILFFADPNSIHDLKWITFFSRNDQNRVFLLPRKLHANFSKEKLLREGINTFDPISDFSFTRFLKTILTAGRVRSIVKEYKVDIIHILYAEPNSLWCLFRDYLGVPMIVSTRGTDVLKTIPNAFENRRLINRVVAPAYRRAFKTADWVTSTSAKQIEAVVSFSGRAQAMSIVRTGVDLDSIRQHADFDTPLPKDVKYILFPRYLYPVYNHEFCLETIELLPKGFKEKYAMVFVGKDAGDLAYQRKLTDRMEDIKGVRFLLLPKRNQEEMYALYRNASLVVMTPFSDGAPVSAMEAMLCGIRVILGPLQYDEDLFSSSAKILRRWDSKELVEAIVKELQDGDAKVTLLPQTIKLMDRNYNMDKMNLLYKELLFKRYECSIAKNKPKEER